MVINKIPVKNIVSRSKISGFSHAINPYVGCSHGCIYCYATFMREVWGHEERWGEFLDVKDFSLAGLEKFACENARKSLFMSSVTDCYNPFEAKFKNTRKILETLASSSVNLQILTKSDLVIRDIDLLKTMPNIRVGVSISVINEGLRRIFEPRASPVIARLEAIKRLREEGIKTFIFVAPIFPKITPVFDIIFQYADMADEIWFDRLNLYPNFKDKILAFIGKNFADLLPLYKQIFLFGDTQYFSNLAREINSEMEAKFGSKSDKFKIFFSH